MKKTADGVYSIMSFKSKSLDFVEDKIFIKKIMRLVLHWIRIDMDSTGLSCPNYIRFLNYMFYILMSLKQIPLCLSQCSPLVQNTKSVYCVVHKNLQ